MAGVASSARPRNLLRRARSAGPTRWLGMITVLTATLGRRPDMLLEAIESVRSQTFTDWEHVIVDDGSFSVRHVYGVQILPVSHRGLVPARKVGLGRARR